jgi:hypothetical protein
LCEPANLKCFTAPDKGARVNNLKLLLNLTDYRGTGALRQCAELGQRIFGLDPFMGTGLDPDQDRTFSFR